MDFPSLLYAQLGHPSLVKIQQIVLNLSKLSNLSCESCYLGKESYNSFSCSVLQRTSSPFVLVYSDIWGPSLVTSNLRFQCLVIFIDDFSRCTYLF